MDNPTYDRTLMISIVDKFLYLYNTSIAICSDHYIIVSGPYKLEVWPDASEEGTVECHFKYNDKGVCVYDFVNPGDRHIIDRLMGFCHRMEEIEEDKKIIQNFLDNY